MASASPLWRRRLCYRSTGVALPIGTFPQGRPQEFTPSADGPDWVLILDDTDRGFTVPGHGVGTALACLTCSETAAQMNNGTLDARLVQQGEVCPRCHNHSQFALYVGAPTECWVVWKPGTLHTSA